MKKIDVVGYCGVGISTFISRTYNREVEYIDAGMSPSGINHVVILFDLTNISTLKKLTRIITFVKDSGCKILSFGNKEDICSGILALDVLETLISSNDIPLMLGSALTGKNMEECLSYIESI